MKIPFFTVIIPVYNVEAYLVRAIDSVLNQDYRDPVEIILIDDGSTDNSGKICDEYGATNTNIRVIHKKNGGLSSARNAGLDIATGKYIVFLDSDDWLDLDALVVFNETLVKKKVEILVSSFRYVDEMGTQTGNGPIESFNKEDIAELLKTSVFIPVAWRRLWSRDFLEENTLRFLEGIYHEDVEFVIRASCLAKTFYIINYHGYNYVQREKSIMTDTRETHLFKRMSNFIFVIGKIDELKRIEKRMEIEDILQKKVESYIMWVLKDLLECHWSKPVSNHVYKLMLQKGFFPPPLLSGNRSFRLIRFLIGKQCPLSVLRIVAKGIERMTSIYWRFRRSLRTCLQS